ncbi:hypothetical protein [Sciscionella marina]|uniref:hypothetical protein n=1 Tax=Sciscionella marina TaxID=508770 RepID=UPI00036D5724|nr:hypothetical protein [Sciscionella marina]
MTISESPVMASASADRFVEDFVGAVAGLFTGARSSAIAPFDPGSRIAIVRGFDKGSRAVRAALTELARAEAGGLVDIAPLPPFGQIPAAENVGLVVVTRDSLLAGAERCAAHWGARVIAPTVLMGGGELAEEQCSALRVRREDSTDTVTRRLYLDGELRLDGQDEALSHVTATPSAEGLVFEGQQRTEPVALEARTSTMGSLDGEPQMFAKGHYELSAAAPFRRIVAA